jgi:formate dehydrogenase subunit delta
MDIDNLVLMANRIGDFFCAMPDRNEAQAGVAEHIKKFWDPRMRKALRQHIDLQSGQGLSGIVLEALRTHDWL